MIWLGKVGNPRTPWDTTGVSVLMNRSPPMLNLPSLFPLLALIAGLVGFLAPELIGALEPAIVPLLGLVMFGMGTTLTPASFRAVRITPRWVLLGVSLQFALMPMLGWGIGQLLQLPPELIVGMVLVGAAPGGTASNVIVFLARGDLALSISLTTVSTLAAVALTPWLTWLYIGEHVPVPVGDMIARVAQIILLPVALGVLVNTGFGRRSDSLRSFLPVVSVLAIAVIIAIVVALNAGRVGQFWGPLVPAVILHNLGGLASAYLLARLLGAALPVRRAVSLEVGMQNSGLAAALASLYFQPAAALPAAFFSVWHNLSGSVLAALWARSSREPH